MMLEAQRLIVAQANTQYGRFFEETGTGIWAEFHHRIGRPVEHLRSDGKKVMAGQPLEHIHNFLISATYSKTREKYLAVDPFMIFMSAPYLQSYFHNLLSNKLVELGYKVERTQDAWEIVGVPKSVLERFSERSKIIDRIAEEKNITDPKEKAKLAAFSRESKSKSVPEHELYDLWKDQLTKDEFEALQKIKGQYKGVSNPISVRDAIDRSLDHFLQRNSTAPVKRVLGHAMALSYGSGYSPEDYENELKARENVLYGQENHIPILTTREMVQAEEEMNRLAIWGKGKKRPLNPDYKIKRDFLNSDQKNAVTQYLRSTGMVVALEGMAGSGKSTLLQELSDGVKAVGKTIIPIAPSSQAVEVLRREGFPEAQTIAAFLINPKLQEGVRDGIICVDEASMSGIPTMSKILSIGKYQNARILLSGNIRQHHSPGEHGDALRILQQRAKIETIHVKQNMRQQTEDYKRAVNYAANGKILESYQVLDKHMKVVEEIPDYDERINKITDTYIEAEKAKRTCLIVSATNSEKDRISDLVREKRKKEGFIRGQEKTFETLKDLSLSESQKKDLISYQENHVVRFIKNQKKAKGEKGMFKAGSHYEVLPRKNKDEVKVRDLKTKQVLTLPHENPEYFTVYQKTQTRIAVGDLIKPTANLTTLQKTKISNGSGQKVKAFVNGNIQLETGKTIAKDSYHIAHNYTSTTYAAQGQTSQEVLVSMNETGGVSDQSYYVAISRGRSRIRVFTGDKDELKRAIVRSGERTTAKDVAREHERRLLEQKQRTHHKTMNKNIEKYAVSRQRQNETTRDISNRVKTDRYE